LRAVTRSIREGQYSVQYIVVDIEILDRWPEVICSPLGAVEKKSANPNDESYQRLQGQCTKAPGFGRIKITRGAKAGLFWFQQILQHGWSENVSFSMNYFPD
ncbi:hypothetical protein PHMEG_00034829, partial [Phytophthora megakarya]